MGIRALELAPIAWDGTILKRKQQAMDYKTYLAEIVALTKQVSQPETHASYPLEINSAARQALFDNLMQEPPMEPYGTGTESDVDVRQAKALALDRAIRQVKKADWRGNKFKEREVRNAIRSKLGDDEGLVDEIFKIVKSQHDY